jgi:magnesium chelatase family protein
MFAKLTSGAIVGLDSIPVAVEVDISGGSLPSFTIVGLADKAVEESKERVRSAIKNSGYQFPPKRIIVNLAPADLPKEGPSYDLPLALGILLASGQLAADLKDSLLLGELSLDGSLRYTKGVLPQVILAKEKGLRKVFLPFQNAKEASIIDNIEIYPVTNLVELLRHLVGQTAIKPQLKIDISTLFDEFADYEFDFSEIAGQESAKRALEIAAAGGHNLLMHGPPGAGKTLLARSLPSILPKLTFDEAIEVTKIYSVAGLLKGKEHLVKKRPFRAPHHSTSLVGLVGGGTHPKPGEISLAHKGVLFLDEIPLFGPQALESLRQPLEDGYVTVSRSLGTLTFPAQFMLVAASNPCPCGYNLDPQKECICTSSQILRYQKRLSRPFLDRIDIAIEVPAVKIQKLEKGEPQEESKKIRERVQDARDRQLERFKNISLGRGGRKIFANCQMANKEVKEFCPLDNRSLALLSTAASQLGLSARGYMRVLKVARTIADLDQSDKIEVAHIAEALGLRAREEG